MQQSNEPARIGLPVRTADGRLLGELGDRMGEYFSVLPDNPNERKYWVALSNVANPASTDQVVVDFDFSELEEKKAGSPGD